MTNELVRANLLPNELRVLYAKSDLQALSDQAVERESLYQYAETEMQSAHHRAVAEVQNDPARQTLLAISNHFGIVLPASNDISAAEYFSKRISDPSHQVDEEAAAAHARTVGRDTARFTHPDVQPDELPEVLSTLSQASAVSPAAYNQTFTAAANVIGRAMGNDSASRLELLRYKATISAQHGRRSRFADKAAVDRATQVEYDKILQSIAPGNFAIGNEIVLYTLGFNGRQLTNPTVGYDDMREFAYQANRLQEVLRDSRHFTDTLTRVLNTPDGKKLLEDFVAHIAALHEAYEPPSAYNIRVNWKLSDALMFVTNSYSKLHGLVREYLRKPDPRDRIGAIALRLASLRN